VQPNQAARRITRPPNKGMKQTSVEHIERSQLIPSVGRTRRRRGGTTDHRVGSRLSRRLRCNEQRAAPPSPASRPLQWLAGAAPAGRLGSEHPGVPPNNAMKLTKGGWWGSGQGSRPVISPNGCHRLGPPNSAPFAAYRCVRPTVAGAARGSSPGRTRREGSSQPYGVAATPPE
jgi:hypothetical protein